MSFSVQPTQRNIMVDYYYVKHRSLLYLFSFIWIFQSLRHLKVPKMKLVKSHMIMKTQVLFIFGNLPQKHILQICVFRTVSKTNSVKWWVLKLRCFWIRILNCSAQTKNDSANGWGLKLHHSLPWHTHKLNATNWGSKCHAIPWLHK